MAAFERREAFHCAEEIRRLAELFFGLLRRRVADLGERAEGCDVVEVSAVAPPLVEVVGSAVQKALRTGENVVLRKTDGARNVVCRADGDVAHLRPLGKRHEPGYRLGKRAVAAEHHKVGEHAGVLRGKLGRVAAAFGEIHRHGVARVGQKLQRVRQSAPEAALSGRRIYYHHKRSFHK